MRISTLVRRIVIAAGWGAFWLYALLTKREEDWRSFFTVACFVLFVQSFWKRIEPKEG